MCSFWTETVKILWFSIISVLCQFSASTTKTQFLTSESPVYIADSPENHTTVSFPNPAACSLSGPDV